MARFDAALRADVTALDKLLADDLDYCTFRGDCLTKTQYLDDIKTGRVRYVSGRAQRAPGSNCSRTPRWSPDVATVTVVRDGAQQTIHISSAVVLAWRDARWQMTTWTSTLLESPPK